MRHKISDVLWKAANEHLASNNKETDWHVGKAQYTCCAVEDACYEMCKTKLDLTDGTKADKLNNRVLRFLKKMGVDTDSTKQFKEFERLPKGEYYGYDYDATKASQGARYAWLMFAYERALEEENE